MEIPFATEPDNPRGLSDIESAEMGSVMSSAGAVWREGGCTWGEALARSGMTTTMRERLLEAQRALV